MKRLTFRSSFGENIEAGEKIFSQKETTSPQTPRLFAFYLMLFLSCGILTIRLVDTQIVKNKEFSGRAEKNRLIVRPAHADRGIIFDRDGRELARNVPGFRLKEEAGRFRFLSFEDALRFSATNSGAAENLEIDSLREYPLGTFFAHVLGFVGEISKEEIEQSTGYSAGDKIGRGGVEEAYEKLLRGVDGREFIEADAQGQKVRLIQKQEPSAGKNLTISISSSLQEKAATAVSETLKNPLYGPRYTGKTPKGAIVVTKVATGEVLVLYSFPGFDPNIFTKQEGFSFSAALFSDKEQPLFDRAIAGAYPPGSTFKIITASAGLEGKFINKNTLFEDTGVITVGQWKFPNWLYLKTGKTDGRLNVVRAITRSNDIFFYKTAETVGLDNLRQMAKKFGLGEPLGIDLPGEKSGLVPSEEWKKEEINDGWYLGDTYHLGIGQGYLLVTPLQVNAWTGVIANGGKLCKPTILNQKSKIPGPSRPRAGKNQKEVKDQIESCRDLGLKKETVELIKEGMIGACKEGGTGWPFFGFKITRSISPAVNSGNAGGPSPLSNGAQDDRQLVPVACKTGTAEFGDPKNRTHAWFTAFSDEPEGIVVTVLVEEGGEGSAVAAPIAKELVPLFLK
ncbi:MAG: penicillin-binding transpeptidase domain-containing protein [bacterium]|nr:penicillin-binding transpeptidase domain-containing protein [bacterium]